MSDVLNAKKQFVTEMAEKFEKSASVIVVNTRGLNVAEDTELRKQLREEGVELRVVKNTMLRRATDEAGIDEEIKEIFTGPTTVAFSYDDVSAPAKVLKEFAEDNDQIVLKGGLVEGNVISVDQIDAIAELPSRDELYSMLASALKGPARKTAQAVNAMAEQPLRNAMLTLQALAEKKEEDAA